MSLENAKYNYMNVEIRKINNINLAMNDAIDGHISYLEDIETKEEALNALLDFLVIARTQVNLLHLAVGDLTKFNDSTILNASRKPSEQIKPCSDNDFKRRLIEFKY